ncbi:MAG: hypothetical protein GY700_10045 [Propionibacteriaceae bacterium]|nr:hypothetical protein [Propionibacteriaceae bacterium]
MSTNRIMREVLYYETKAQAMESVARRHGVKPRDLDEIPHPRSDVPATYLSYGPDDEDVELVSWGDD